MTSFAALTDDLVAYWTFDETSGGRFDSTENNNDLTDNNTTSYSTGKISNAANLISSNSEFFNIIDGNSPTLSLSDNFSASFWVNFTSLPTDGNPMKFFMKYDASNGYQFEYTRTGTTLQFEPKIAGIEKQFDYTLNTGTWYFITFNFNDTTHILEIFVNGVSIGTLSDFGTLSAPSGYDFWIGSNWGVSRFLDGKIDELGIWSRLLTTDEITALYNSGAGLTYPLSTSTPPATGSTTATTTSGNVFVENLGDISFGLAILIGLNSLALIGFAFNTLNKRKRAWQS